MKTILQILQAARALIAAGWCQNISQKVHLYGAWEYNLLQAVFSSGGSDRAKSEVILQFLFDAIDSEHSRPLDCNELYDKLVVWNDDPSRTKENVLAAIDKAIEQAGVAGLSNKVLKYHFEKE